ncbi:MAG: MBL fold metallo-hydrolase [Desulfobacterales bacterium]
MKMKFWGVRGSIPCPGPNTVKYGGNTSCIELCFEDLKRHIVIDAGSGLRELGNDMMTRSTNGLELPVEIFVTHTHWDHIQGFPFFTPIYIPKTEIKIYGPATGEHETLMDAMTGQLSYRYFPVRESELSAKIEYTELKEGRYDLGDGLILTTKYLNHPLLCQGYRFTYQDKTICTAFDTEPFLNLFEMDPDDPSYDEAMVNEGQMAADDLNRGIAEFVAGADVLIYDGQYTEEEYLASKVGWGHTSIEQAVAEGRRNGVKHLVLYHHEPVRTDAELDQLTEKYSTSHAPDEPVISFAQEGMEIEV